MGLEVVNYIKTEKGYVEQNEADKDELKEFTDRASDRFMSFCNCEREKEEKTA